MTPETPGSDRFDVAVKRLPKGAGRHRRAKDATVRLEREARLR